MDPVKPSELKVAARAADALVYVAGVAGIVAGALLFREGDVPFAMIAWVVTFIAGTVLRLAAWMARGVAQLMVQGDRTAGDVAQLLRDNAASDHQPERPWGSWH